MVALDLKHIWHPCTQMKDHESLPLIPIQSAHGVYIKDFENNEYIDAISSWWVNIFGHTNAFINEQIKAQLDTLEHVIFAGFTHPQIVKLSERLVKLTPQGLEKCFYADNGSSAFTFRDSKYLCPSRTTLEQGTSGKHETPQSS